MGVPNSTWLTRKSLGSSKKRTREFSQKRTSYLMNFKEIHYGRDAEPSTWTYKVHKSTKRKCRLNADRHAGKRGEPAKARKCDKKTRGHICAPAPPLKQTKSTMIDGLREGTSSGEAEQHNDSCESIRTSCECCARSQGTSSQQISRFRHLLR